MKNGIFPKLILTLFIIMSFCLSATAQEAKVKGRLIDSASRKPISDATINFLQPQSKVSTTVIADKDGTFQTSLAMGPYKVTISHSGYRKKTMHLAAQEKHHDMGEIELVAMAKNLAGVTVVATRPMVELKDDRLIYNVEEDPAAKSESASDLLRKTPFVTVDGDGGVQVNGQTNFKVLLDGRETAMFTQNVKEALKAFPGAAIARIEVITSPSAKYDAEGVGGIINIVTKSKVVGYNGTVNTNITSIGNRSGGFNFNMKKGRLGVSAMYHMMSNNDNLTSQMAITTPTTPMVFSRREVGGTRKNDLFFHQGNIEISYDLDSTNTLVVYGNLGKHQNEGVNDYSIYTLFPNGSSDIDPYTLDNRIAAPSHGFGSDYIRKYKGKPQKEFTLRFQGLYHRNRNYSNSLQEMNNADRFILNNSEAFNREYTFQADFIEPVNKTLRIETGVKAILRDAYSDFESQVKLNKADPYQVDPKNSNHFSYEQNVYGGYVSVNKTTKAVTIRAGVRVEHTNVDGDFKTTGTTVRQDYTNLIPNLMLTKQFNKALNSSLSYTFRLGRPSIYSLNPFVNNSDSMFISYGNPNLGPQHIHSFMLQNKIFKGSKFISINAGYNHSNDLIIQNPMFDPSTGVTSITSANAGQIREYVLGFVSNLPIGKKWNIAVNATGRLARMRNKLQSPWTTHTLGNVNGNFSFKATPEFTITSNSGYFVPLRMPNSTFPVNYFYGFNFIYKVFKGKLSLNASVTNFFEKNRELEFKTQTEAFLTENIHTIPFRNFGFSMSYNFGRLKENVSKKKGITNDDAVQ